jgi:signal transduction histidine kinase
MDVNHPQKYLNYRSLVEKGISPDLIPADAVIFGKPMSFYEKHRHTVWIISLLSLLVIYLIVRYIFTQRNLRHEREKEVMHLRRYEVLFNNMPISYLRYYVFRDDKGEFAYQLLNKNMACDKMFIDFEGNKNLSFIESLIFAEAERDRIEAVANNGQSSLYQEVQSSESGKNYDVYICQSEKKSIIDIFMIDKTKQIEALHKMLKYARMNNRILEMLPDNIIIFRKDHAISKLINQSNDNSAFMLSEIINKTSTNPAFDKVRNQFAKAIDEAFATNELVTFDYQMQTPGGLGYFKARLNTISNTQVCCNIHDYSEMMKDKIDVLNSKVELEHLNHKLQIVLDAAFVTPWTIDLKKQTVIVLGKEYQVEDIRKRVHPDDIKNYNDCIESLISNHDKQGIEPHNIRINFNGHRFHWYKMRCIVDTFDKQGNPSILIGSAEDIDKQKQIEDNLIEAKEKAEESNKLKSAFIANMSHEIRTPLNAIIGFSEVLSVSQSLSEEEKVLFRKNIATNKDLLMQLFSDILDLAKIDAGTIEFNYVEEDFTSIIKSVATSARLRENSNKDVKLIIEDVPDSCILFTDPHRVTQVITNFVNNAIKFTIAGTISIGYSITEDNMIYCHVTDTGIGISKEQQPKIFERFVKLNSFKQGTGLGLSICKMIIEKMNGQIGVVSEQDKGSTFWFKIPILKEAPLMEENG